MLTMEFNPIPTDPADARRLSRSWEKARKLGQEGYNLSQSVRAPWLYWVEKCYGTLYAVNAEKHSCTCPDFERHGKYCKHLLFVARCLRYAATLR